MLTDEQTAQVEAWKTQLQAVGDTHGKIGHVEHEGHVLAWTIPNDTQAREYKRKAGDPDRVKQLLQQTIVFCDGETDRGRCVALFNLLWAEYPFFDDNSRVQTVVSVLTGVVEEAAAGLLGKGCLIWRRATKRSRTDSASGSSTGMQPQTAPLPAAS